MKSKTFRIQLNLPLEVEIEGQQFTRDDFFTWAWTRFGNTGLVGIHEGTAISTEKVLDSAEPPSDRDWVREAKLTTTDLYFSSQLSAEMR